MLPNVRPVQELLGSLIVKTVTAGFAENMKSLQHLTWPTLES